MIESNGVGADQSADSSPTSRPRALVVDDNDVNRKVIMAMLGKLGIDSVEACGGHEALVWYKNERFDAIFMDWHMPDMDGLAATGEIRRMEAEARAEGGPDEHIPIVAVTASALVGDREQCLEAGMDDYLSKPTTLEGLQEMIDKWIIQSGAVEAARQDQTPGAQVDETVAATLRKLGEELGDESIVHMLIDTFMDELPKWRDNLDQARQVGDADNMTLAAHTTKSAARSLGLEALADLCQQLETAGRNQEATEPLQALAGDVLNTMDDAAETLTAFKNSQVAMAG